MQRRALFDFLFLAVVSWGFCILIAIGVHAVNHETLRPVILGFILLLVGAIIGVYSLSRSATGSSPKSGNAWLFIAAFAISLSCSLLFMGLFFALEAGGKPQMSPTVVLSLSLLPVSTLISLAITAMLSTSANAAPQGAAGSYGAESAKPRQVNIDDVVLTDTGAVCPLCRRHPHQYNHVMIQCPNCKARFCSQHLDDTGFRCYKCRSLIPFQKEIKLFILNRR